MRWICSILWLVLALACGGPVGPFPGGQLSGREHPYPRDGFGFAAAEERVAVEVGGNSPHSVHTWAIVLEDTLFIPADFFNPGKRWPQLAMDDPRARIRVVEEVYPCRLLRIEDGELIDRLRAATAEKYEIEPDSWAARIEVWWFRIERRRTPGPHPLD
ncbi:MAG: hypothetical protein JRH01_05745 [Deltaproteobacteria bacterium]|nr:hypothetical protein [Deltaproteobacteria bacterium]MBW2394685.1 hypothetical protein [Deltaproteobacteria bacterium]